MTRPAGGPPERRPGRDRYELPPERRAHGTAAMAVTRTTARALGRSLARVELTGLEHLPSAGGVLLAANHQSYVDGPLLYGLLPRPVVFLVKDEVFHGPVGAMLRRIGQIPVRRGTAERAPLLAALGTLAAGGVVGVFPQGTRASDVDEVQRGVAYLALRSGCPVVPVACHGTADVRPRILLRRERPPVRVVVGPPLVLAAEGSLSRRTVTAAADRVRTALAAHVAATRPTPTPAPEDEQ